MNTKVQSLDHPATSAPPDSDRPPAYHDLNVPDITSGFASLNLSSRPSRNAIPTEEACIAHLKLLEALSTLRENISRQDGLYGIYDRFVPEKAPTEYKIQNQSKIREKRWAVYVANAVRRFETYFQTLLPGSFMTTRAHMQEDYYSRMTSIVDQIDWTVENLPPLGKAPT